MHSIVDCVLGKYPVSFLCAFRVWHNAWYTGIRYLFIKVIVQGEPQCLENLLEY